MIRLFRHNCDLGGIERVALSVGLGIGVAFIFGLWLQYSHGGIRLWTVTVLLVLLDIHKRLQFYTSNEPPMTLCSRKKDEKSMAIGLMDWYFMRIKLIQEKSLPVKFGYRLNNLKKLLFDESSSKIEKLLVVLLMILLIVSISALVYIIVTPKQGEKFTEFYILGPGGKAYDYPISVVSGQDSTVIVGIVNHEYCEVNYTLDLVLDNSSLNMKKECSLGHNQIWEELLNYTLVKPGDQQKLEFLLYKELNFSSPYRDLYLWVNVSEKEASGVEFNSKPSSDSRAS